ncbi:UPF0271 protein [Diaminobutyricimonas aerilata]|uniref:5-oxoprolinase subunit A n=1 Tax=Diaminobutyricimonas aerilata TaxID=1162967 RepID=A0A2M9CMG8_9MICO|nr:5-oxoprolinase subunit PxpA [Diaminobutyricimonas aerilata]PJJ73086.1 UPF0271 protein [Diaminobutyricimonas aerilata]
MTTVDLNSDLGESFGDVRVGDDAAMFPLVTSANLACGFHGGDPVTMLDSCWLAFEHSVTIGAHPSYRDLEGFGRRAQERTWRELYAEVLYQVAALMTMGPTSGGSVKYIKPHGALYNRVMVDPEQAEPVAAVARNLQLPLLGLAGSALHRAAESMAVRFVREAFVDRAYAPDGTLVPRSEPGAVLTDAAAVADRALRMVREGTVEAIDGTVIRVEVDSLCVHGDSPHAVEMTRAVRDRLLGAGVELRAFA